VRKTFKYRIYPTKAQEQELLRWLDACRRLYNVLLEQRILAYQRGIRLNKYQQMREITELRKAMPEEYGRIGSHVLQDVAKRLDQSFKRFFAGAGYPKFQSARRYTSFTFPDQAGWKLRDGRLHITNIGSIKVKWSRPIEGTIKTLTIKYRAGQWYACFSCDNVPAPQYPETDKAVGIDLGIEALVTTSDGERFPNAKYLHRSLKRLRRLQRKLARQQKGSNRRKRTIRQIQRLHLKIANQRADAHHKASTALVRRYALIAHEAVSPQFMLQNKRMARAAADVGWRQFLTFLQNKAAAAGRKVVAVDPRNTSQACSGCGALVPKELHERWHTCPHCGLSVHRDVNAARNILHRAVA